jgi:hypothetical protein
MIRLRRGDDHSGILPAAAEVLEARSLLSGAAAAVHSAEQHAAAITPAASTVTFPGVLQLVEGVDTENVPGTIKFHPAQVTVGSHLSVHFVGHIGPHITYTISLKATVASIDTSHGPEAIVTLTNDAGSFVGNDNEPGHHTHGVAALSNFALFLDPDGSLVALTGNFIVTHPTPGAPVGTHGTFGLTPP